MTIFGFVGVLFCLTAFIFVWLAGIKINSVASNTIEQTVSRLNSLVAVVTDAQTEIVIARGVARELEERIRGQVNDHLRETIKPGSDVMIKLTELEGTLQGGLDKAYQWVDGANAILGLTEEVTVIIESTDMFFTQNPVSFDKIENALELVSNEIARVDAYAVTLKEQITDIQNGREIADGGVKIKMLSDQIDASLNNLSGYAEGFEAVITKVTDVANRIRIKIRNLILVSQLMLTLFLIWQTAAQLSLIMLGRTWSVGLRFPGEVKQL